MAIEETEARVGQFLLLFSGEVESVDSMMVIYLILFLSL